MNITSMTSTILLVAVLSACASAGKSNPPHAIVPEEDVSAAQEKAYQACLQDNMAVATDWSIIEEQCRRQVSGEPDPIGEEPPRD